MSKFTAWVAAARLRTLPLSVSGILTGTAIAVGGDVFELSIFIFALFTTLSFQVLSNFANDYGDWSKGTDNEERIGPKRVMQSGLLSARELKQGIFFTAALSLILACLLIFISFQDTDYRISLFFFLLGVAAIAAAIKYTVGESAYGYRAMGDIFVFLFFGVVAVVGSYFLYAESISGMVFLPAVTIGLLSATVLNLNNMRDRVPDQKAGKITLAVLLAEKKAKMYHYSLILVALLSILLYFYLTEAATFYYITLLAFVPLLLHLRVVNRNESPAMLDPELKKVALSTFLFSLLFLLAAFFHQNF